MKALKKKPIQVYLEPQQNNVLDVLAKKEGISKAEVIRRSLEKFFKGIPLEEDPAMGLIGLGGSKKVISPFGTINILPDTPDLKGSDASRKYFR